MKCGLPKETKHIDNDPSFRLNHSHLLLSIGSQLTAHVDFLRLTLKTFMGNYTAIAILSGFI